jgi:hypothetical protein
VAITLALLVGWSVPVLMAMACVVIARHFYPRGQRFWAGLGGATAAIGLPVLVLIGLRNAGGMHARLGELGPFISIVLFAAASFVAPGVLLWIRINHGNRS